LSIEWFVLYYLYQWLSGGGAEGGTAGIGWSLSLLHPENIFMHIA